MLGLGSIEPPNLLASYGPQLMGVGVPYNNKSSSLPRTQR